MDLSMNYELSLEWMLGRKWKGMKFIRNNGWGLGTNKPQVLEKRRMRGESCIKALLQYEV